MLFRAFVLETNDTHRKNAFPATVSFVLLFLMISWNGAEYVV